MKLWQGRFEQPTAKDADDFNDSLPFDKKLWREDITASVAHARMLGKCGIISAAECDEICGGLEAIYADIESGAIEIKDAEDIHSFVENELVARIGDSGKKTAPRPLEKRPGGNRLPTLCKAGGRRRRKGALQPC